VPRIAHLITGLETGGAERMLVRLVAASDLDRFPSIVISMTGPHKDIPELSRRGVSIYSLGIRRGVPDPRMLPRLARLLRRFQPDVLQTWLYHADALGWVAREFGLVPRLAWNLRCTSSTGATGVRALLGRASSRPDAVIVNSLAGQGFHQQHGYHPRRWVHIPNGFDCAALAPSPTARAQGRTRLGFAPDAVVILLPARYHAMKDHANFLAAAERLAKQHGGVRFALAGRGAGPENAALARSIRAHRLEARVSLLGQLDDLDALYPAFDIVTLSSAFGEGFPNVLGEAMAAGVPCVATDVGDVAAIIGDTGGVVPPRNPAALAEGWDALIRLGPQGRVALGARARVRVAENWNMGSIVSQYCTLYEYLMSEPATERSSAVTGVVRPFGA
jgi:glycosyltransferase involved in cell wall biosynthesis